MYEQAIGVSGSHTRHMCSHGVSQRRMTIYFHRVLELTMPSCSSGQCMSAMGHTGPHCARFVVVAVAAIVEVVAIVVIDEVVASPLAEVKCLATWKEVGTHALAMA